uniref:HEAT repeat-containing protein 1 n=1 Tax=Amphiprion ocellaris TaxID=80972 RepID=A0AAQ5ZYX5_AMPOC
MTSLAHQLKRLALPQNDSNLLVRREVASLLFDPKDAATMDRSTFYALGCTGLEELLGIEPAFLEFQDTLFSRASLTLERSVQSKEVNEKLDAGISLFLTRLCPYFLLKPAHKCIEWLVHRFHIQLYNADMLLSCALPYHDTNVFVRVLQLLKIKDATNQWNWLHCLQKPGVPLSRGALINHCYSDLSFMDFICSMVTRSIQVRHSGNCSQLRVIFSFYASTIVPALDAVDKVSDTIISKLLPYVQKGLKSSLTDYKAATYMIVCQLAVKVVMESSLVDSLAVHISKSLVKEPVLAKEGLGCLTVLLQNQKEAVGRLCSMPALVSTLQVMAAVHDVRPLLRYLLPHLVHSVFAGSSVLLCFSFRLLLDEYLSQTELSAENLSALDQRLLPLVRLFESKYVGALDSILAGHVTDISDTQQKHLFHHFLSLSLCSGKFQILGDSDTSLLLSLKHPQPSVRVSAVEHLMDIVTSGQSSGVFVCLALVLFLFSSGFFFFCFQESGRLVSDWPSFSEALTAYLSRCEQQPGEPADLEFGCVLTCLLRDFIQTLRCDDASFKGKLDSPGRVIGCSLTWPCDWPLTRHVTAGEVWWNPEKMDTNTCCYLGLLCRMFSVLVFFFFMCISLFYYFYNNLILNVTLNLQVHLGDPVMLFRFLSILWGYGSNHGDQLDVKVGAVLQTQALYMGGALLSNQPDAMLETLAATDSPVVPSLLCCLSSPVREVRRSALAALKSLSGASSPFQPITERLLKTSEEIISLLFSLSVSSLQVLGVLHAESSSSKSRKLQASMQQLLSTVQTSSCPSYNSAALLDALSNVSGQSVLSVLLPVLDRLLETGPDTPSLLRDEARLMQLVLGKFDEASAPLLVRDQNCLDLFIRALRTPTQQHPDVPSCQMMALEQISKSFFSALGDEKVQQKILSVLFDLLVESRSPAVADAISSSFKGISVDAQLVANELSPPQKPNVSVTVQQTRRSRATQRKPAEGSGPEGGAVSWRRVTLILELLQHKKKLRRSQSLVPVLFSLLASLEPGSADHANMEYTKQLLLSCLLNICNRLSPGGGAADVLDEEKFSVELVVQVIRASDVPQTHHHALLLLGTAAAIFPEKVLLNIMPIFTFMGANLLRLDDAYSFRVIDQTVQMVVPALIQLSDGGSSSHLVAVVTRIVHVFVDALPHVPEHRRQPILTQLVTTLGPAHFLWVLMLLLFKQHATQTDGSASEKDEALDRDVDFWVSVCSHFDVGDQLTSLINILNFLLQLPDDKDDGETMRRNHETNFSEKLEDLIFSLEAHSGKELRHFKFLNVSFMAQLLGSTSFIRKVAEGGDDVDATLQPLLEEILRYIHSVARCVEENSDKPTAKFWRVLLNKTYDVLDKVNALLPTDTFITVTRGLMGNELPSVRRKAMELLNNKLQQRTQWEEPQVSALLQLTSDLLSIVGSGHVTEGAELAINRQTALYSLKLLCRCFGSAHQEAFVPVLQQAVQVVTVTDEDRNVMGSALLCVAEVVGTLKTLAIPQLPRLMPAVLHVLSDRKELLSSEIYLLSVVTAMQRVMETLPHFISPYLQDTIIQLSARLASLRSSIATLLPPRVLLPSLSRFYSNLLVDRKQLVALMSILKEHIGHMDREQLNVHQSELTSFFLTALNFRCQHPQVGKTSRIEGCVIDCLIAMVMKLSEITFRPLFFKLLDWSKSDSSDRLLTFVRLSDGVAERLKGIFVLFAGNLVTPFSELLRRSNSDELLFASDLAEEKTSLLLDLVLDCLQKIFLYDTQRFLSRERAEALLKPLVDQLENQVGGQQVYQQRVSQHLVPCLGQFAVALADDSQWKTLNYQILMKTRHPDSKVRFSSLLMLMELASKLKENYVVLLPETIPFLAELMEGEEPKQDIVSRYISLNII